MKKLMHILFLSCLKATELIEKKFYFKLTVREKLQLKLHKMMCNACTNYEHQSIILDKAMHAASKHDVVVMDLDAFKKDVIRKLEKSK
jgi:hypothetical protein